MKQPKPLTFPQRLTDVVWRSFALAVMFVSIGVFVWACLLLGSQVLYWPADSLSRRTGSAVAAHLNGDTATREAVSESVLSSVGSAQKFAVCSELHA